MAPKRERKAVENQKRSEEGKKSKEAESGKREIRSRGEGAKCETHGPAHKMGTKETS